MIERKFTCDGCHATFISEWTEGDAMAEYEGKFGKHLGEELGVLCDYCQKAFDEWFARQDKGSITQ